MKYIIASAKGLWKGLVCVIGGSVALGALFGLYARSKGDTFQKPFLMFLCAGILISIALILLIASVLRKEEPLQKILAEKGYGDEYLQEFDRIYPPTNVTNKLRKADVLNTMRRFAESEQLLATIQTFGLSDDRKMEYHNTRLDLFLSTHRFAEAQQELAACRQFMDIYVQGKGNAARGMVFDLNAAVTLATANDFEGSEHYMKEAERSLNSLKDQISPVMFMIARTMQLYALGFEKQAEEQAEKTRQEIMNSTKLEKAWQKEHFLAQLSRAAEFAPKNDSKE
ncbi:MAG: hypothetical protein K5705_01660 [Oscillospiraceae bacterium]|nr:hypothetical protein [Oscillospiraceae bacterium]